MHELSLAEVGSLNKTVRADDSTTIERIDTLGERRTRHRSAAQRRAWRRQDAFSRGVRPALPARAAGGGAALRRGTHAQRHRRATRCLGEPRVADPHRAARASARAPDATTSPCSPRAADRISRFSRGWRLLGSRWMSASSSLHPAWSPNRPARISFRTISRTPRRRATSPMRPRATASTKCCSTAPKHTSRSATVSLGVSVGKAYTDMNPASMQTTNEPLDFGIVGTGFFAVQTAQGVRYTRDGQFTTSAQGLLDRRPGQ